MNNSNATSPRRSASDDKRSPRRASVAPRLSPVVISTLAWAIIFPTGCSNVKSEIVTPSNRDQILERIAKSNLPESDRRAYLAATLRTVFQKDSALDGKTVGQIIDEQQHWQQTEDAKAAAEKEAQAKEERRLAALHEEMLDVLHIYPLSKTVIPADAENGSFRDTIKLSLVIQNRSARVVHAFKGVTTFSTELGDKLESNRLIYEATLAPHSSSTYIGHIDVVTTDDEKLGQLPLSRLNFSFKPERIIFGDGRSLVAEGAVGSDGLDKEL